MFARMKAVFVLSLFLPSVTVAQGNPVELGVDAAFSVDFNGGTATSFALPAASVRAGFFVGNQFSIEPGVGFNYIKLEDVDAFYTLDFSLSGLYHFQADAARPRPYIRGGGGLFLVGGGGETASQFGAGGGVGVKMPVASQLAVRLEASFLHGFENDDFFSVNTVSALIGFSVFTR